ncbi:hypothetical protein BDR03DRAFT_872623 [Suillus americanus]|nr:hypothetical protein BDR03DRAFT_872623 [Suillus americanus]
MSQQFDAHAYHINHATLNSYTASPNLLETTAWQPTSTGLEVVNTDEEPFLATIVGRASVYHLRCGPGGNHFDGGFSPLEKVKYQFLLTRPANPELAADFTATINNLEELQSK